MSKTIASLIDHTLLRPTATVRDIDTLCAEAIEHGFASVCVLPSRVKQAALLLKESPVAVCTVIGFPLGGTSTATKCAEAAQALLDGATEIDIVANIGLVKDGNWAAVEEDIRAVRDIFYDDLLNDNLIKVIFETCLLNYEEKRELCRLCAELHIDFVKTSTGFSTGGATVEDVILMKKSTEGSCEVKASGGIRTLAVAQAMVASGATRLGTSHGVAIATDKAAGSEVY